MHLWQFYFSQRRGTLDQRQQISENNYDPNEHPVKKLTSPEVITHDTILIAQAQQRE